MASELLDRRDIDFQLHTWLKVGELVDRETVGAIVDLSEKLYLQPAFVPLHRFRGWQRTSEFSDADETHARDQVNQPLRYSDE